MVCGMLWYVAVRLNGGETVCLTQIQVIDYDSFFRLHSILPHILPHIEIRVTAGVSCSILDWIAGGVLKLAGLASSIAGSIDWLADMMSWSFIRAIVFKI